MRFLLLTAALMACSANADAPDRGADNDHRRSVNRVVNVGDDQGIAVLYDGQTPTIGSANRVRQARAAGDFARVIVNDALDAEIAIGPNAAIEVEGDDNLIDRIRTDAEGGTLHLRVRDGYRVRRPMLVRIITPRLDRVDLEASGDARISGLNGGRLSLAGHGSGSFDVDGRVDLVEVRIQGSGDAELADLRAGEARILINGSGDARAHVTDTIVATVNGTGEIIYRGRPRHVAQEVNGTGRISRED